MNYMYKKPKCFAFEFEQFAVYFYRALFLMRLIKSKNDHYHPVLLIIRALSLNIYDRNNVYKHIN